MFPMYLFIFYSAITLRSDAEENMSRGLKFGME